MSRVALAVVLSLVGSGLLIAADESPVGKLRQEYAKAKVAAVMPVNKTYAGEVEKVFMALNDKNDAKNARRAENFYMRLRDAIVTNDLEGIGVAAVEGDPLEDIKWRYAKARGGAMEKLNAEYLEKGKALKAQLPAGSDPKVQLEAAAFLEEIAPSGVPTDGMGKGKFALLQPVYASRWKIENGEWKIEDGKLTGKGASNIVFPGDQPMPFTLSFTIKVLEGMRPRVKMGAVTFANEGFEKIFLLYPIEQPSTAFPYELNKDYRISIAVSHKETVMSIDGKVTARSKGNAEMIEKFRFSAGDKFSKGAVEYRDIVVERDIAGGK